MLIQSIGIKDIQTPIKVLEKGGGLQATIATISIQASMPGTRDKSCVDVFTSALNNSLGEISVGFRISQIQENSGEGATGDEPLYRKAPVTKTRSLMEYGCVFRQGRR
jgi:GTP cyclohydrolase I